MRGLKTEPRESAADLRQELKGIYEVIRDTTLRLQANKETLPEMKGHFSRAEAELDMSKRLVKGVLGDEPAVSIQEYKYFRDKLEEARERAQQFRLLISERYSVIAGIERNLRWLQDKQAEKQKLLAITEDNVLLLPEMS